MGTATFILPKKPTAQKRGTIPQHLWPKFVRHDNDKIRRRVKTLRRLSSIASRDPGDIMSDTSPHIFLWKEVNTPVLIHTDLSLPPRDIASLGKMHREDMVTNGDTTPSKFQSCFKYLRRVTRIRIQDARNLRRTRYGKALLRLFVNKPSVALRYILRTTEGAARTPSLLTNLFGLGDETAGRLITAPEEVAAKITQLKPAARSPDHTLPLGALFPWLACDRLTPSSLIPIILAV